MTTIQRKRCGFLHGICPSWRTGAVTPSLTFLCSSSELRINKRKIHTLSAWPPLCLIGYINLVRHALDRVSRALSTQCDENALLKKMANTNWTRPHNSDKLFFFIKAACHTPLEIWTYDIKNHPEYGWFSYGEKNSVLGADERTWTFTYLRTLAPEASASTNSATSAWATRQL